MTIINSCDSTSGWDTNTSTTIDTDNSIYNSSPSSLKLTNTTAEANALTVFDSIDMTNLDYISLWVYVADYSHISYMSVDLYSENWVGSYAYEIDSSNYESNGWKHITIPKASFNVGWGSPVWSIIGFNFYTYNSDTGTANVYLDTIEYFLFSNINITPEVMESNSGMVVPAIGIGSNITSVVMESVSDMISPVISQGVNILPTVMESVGEAIEPLVSTGSNIVMNIMDSSSSMNTPTIGIGINIVSEVMESNSEGLAPSITTVNNINIQSVVMESFSNMMSPMIRVDSWISPVTNWISNDYLNPEDLNRIESNIRYLESLALEYFINPNLLGIKVNWSNTDYIYHTIMNKIESNIKLLSDCTYIPFDWVTPVTNWVTSDKLSYIDFNRIEGNIMGLYTMYYKIIAEFEYCGQIYCGQTFAL